MTKNQIDALRNLETERHNKEEERIAKALIPAQYISSIGSLARGASGFFKIGGGKIGSKGSANVINLKGPRKYMDQPFDKYTRTHPQPLKWTIQ